ncbi:MAG: alpha/beta hydrolase [Microthrixaceae bacterium]
MSESTPTLLALHGHGESTASATLWAQPMAPPRWQVVALQAPGGRSEPNSWFDTGPRGVDAADLERSVRAVEASALRHSALGPVALVGFSQGAAMALACGDLTGVEAVVAVCPFLPEVEGLDLSAGAPTLVLPARDDEVVPAFLGSDLAAAMSGAGRSVELRVMAGAHEVTSEAAEFVRMWLTDRIATPGQS